MTHAKSHFSILSLLALTSAIGLFFGMHVWSARTDSDRVAYLFFNSALPLGFLTCAYQAVYRKPGRSLAIYAAVATILWGVAIAGVFSRDSRLARLIDPHDQLLNFEFWLVFILLQTVTAVLLSVAIAWPYRQLLKSVLLRKRLDRRYLHEFLRYTRSVNSTIPQRRQLESSPSTWEFIEFNENLPEPDRLPNTPKDCLE